MNDTMQTRVIEAVVALSAGSITYSWVQEATEITSLAAAVVGVITACLAGWFYFERAMKMRKEREYEDQDRRHSRRTSLLDGKGNSVGRDKIK